MNPLLLIVTIALLIATVAVIVATRRDFVRARSNPQQHVWARAHGGRLGFYPPMREPLGIALTIVSIGAIAAFALLAVYDTPATAAPVMLVALLANIWNNHRNLDWLHSHTEYRELAKH